MAEPALRSAKGPTRHGAPLAEPGPVRARSKPTSSRRCTASSPRSRACRSRFAGEPGPRADRPVRLRQVHLPPLAQPDARALRARLDHRPGAARRRGHLRAAGERDAAAPPIGMVFQRPTPFPTMSDLRQRGGRAAGARGRLRGPSSTTWSSARCTQAALWDEVKDRLHASAMALSGGQQQRLCIARTIAPSPEVILLDEPTASLDPQGTQRIEELLFELKRQFTIIIVTHNMQQAARVSDTTTFFYLGRWSRPARPGRSSPRHGTSRPRPTSPGRFG